jgi:hypothetical protein
MATVLALVGLTVAAHAQIPQTLSPNVVVGRLGVTPGPPQQIPFNTLAAQLVLSGCNIFTAGSTGCVPASGGGVTNFLRADGAWAAPPGGAGGTPSAPLNSVQFNNASAFGGSANFTWSNPTLTIGLAGSTTGQLGMAGGTSGVTILEATGIASGTLTLPAATDTLVGKATTDRFTNKNFDTADAGNVFKINGNTVNAVSGNTAKVPTVAGALVNGQCVQADANLNLVTSGGGCGGGGTNPGAPVNSVQFNAAGVFAGSANMTFVSPVLTIGAAGVTGQLALAGSTSGATALQGVAAASGTLTVPSTNDTLVARNTTDALTNKSINGMTITASTGTFTLAAGKTLTANSSLTLAGVDAKTLTVNKSLTLDGTDGTVMTFPTTSATITQTIASGTLALNQTAIGSGACSAAQTAAAAGVATTDTIQIGFNGDPTGTTGYIPATAGMLTIIPYPTAGNINVKVCNNSSASITPGAVVTLNWRVVR